MVIRLASDGVSAIPAGIPVSLFSSLLNALRSPFQKHVGQYIRNPFMANAVCGIAQIPLNLLVVLLMGEPIIPLSSTFRSCVLAVAILNSTAEALLVYALQIAPLSHTVPFTILSLPFLTITSSTILGEKATWRGILGVMLMCSAAFYLKFTSTCKKKSEKSAKVQTMSHKGSLICVLVAGLWSLSSPLDKVAMKHSTPIQFVLWATTVKVLINLLVVYTMYSRKGSIESREEVIRIAPGGLQYVLSGAIIGGFGYFLHATGANRIPVVYNSAIRRMGMIVTVLYGAIVFREKNLLSTLMAVSVMIIGVLLIITQPKPVEPVES
ncbi:hypothetical protein AAMO2058_000579500 [Amorphochlora amoebiformis]